MSSVHIAIANGRGTADASQVAQGAQIQQRMERQAGVQQQEGAQVPRLVEGALRHQTLHQATWRVIHT